MAPKKAAVSRPTSLFDVAADFYDCVHIYRKEDDRARLAEHSTDAAPSAAAVADAEELKLQVVADAEGAVAVHDGLQALSLDTEPVNLVGSAGNLAEAPAERKDALPLSQKGMTCGLCGNCQFQSVMEQRLHFKGDWHRINLKRKVKRKMPFTEEEFEAKLAQQELPKRSKASQEKDGEESSGVSSISGSESESGSSGGESIGGSGRRRQLLEARRRPKFIFFHEREQEKFAIWQSVLVGEKESLSQGAIAKDANSADANTLINRLKDMASLAVVGKGQQVVLPKEGQKKGEGVGGGGGGATSSLVGAYWMILIAGGGHFAGVVVDASANGAVVAHQTFHRYVVRAKQGGRQSAKDATGRAPKSGGASLRRYNEAALAQDIQTLLKDTWKAYVEQALLVFVRASSADARTLFGGDAPPLLRRSDPRIRAIPFATRRATFKEACRTAQLLASIDWSPREDEHTPGPSAPPPTSLPNKASSALSSSSCLSKQTPSSAQPGEPQHQRVPPDAHPAAMNIYYNASEGHFVAVEPDDDDDDYDRKRLMAESTPLHDAALAGDAGLIQSLLEGGANPQVRDGRGRVPYMLAPDKESRNVFRRFMAENPRAFNWHDAGVPSPLTQDMEAAQDAKRAEKKARLKEREKEKRRLRRAEEKAKQESAQSSGKGTVPSSKQEEEERVRAASALSASDARALRAAAAERRLQALQMQGQEPAATAMVPSSSRPSSAAATSATCDCCGASLAKITPFHKFEFKYCSTTCVRVHSTTQQA